MSARSVPSIRVSNFFFPRTSKRTAKEVLVRPDELGIDLWEGYRGSPDRESGSAKWQRPRPHNLVSWEG